MSAEARRRLGARRREARRKANLAVAVGLERYQTHERRFVEGPLAPRIKRLVLERARKLMDPIHQRTLEALGRGDWVRIPEAWVVRGKSPNTQRWSLVRHLWVEFPVPTFMESVFELEDDALREVGLTTFIHLGRGGSLYQLVRDGRLPVPLTRRMCHRFLQSGAERGFVEAIRIAQVDGLGGTPALAQAVVATRQLGRGLTGDEGFWAGVIHWACNELEGCLTQLGPIIDWIDSRRTNDPTFSMKGRTRSSVLRAMEQWHGALAIVDAAGDADLPASGLQGWYWERPSTEGEDEVEVEVEVEPSTDRRCVIEIVNAHELAREGHFLRHCVASYACMIRAGRSSIWSYRINGKRKLTIEVDHRRRRVVQCRGRANRLPTREEMNRLQAWIHDNQLVVSPQLPVAD